MLATPVTFLTNGSLFLRYSDDTYGVGDAPLNPYGRLNGRQ